MIVEYKLGRFENAEDIARRYNLNIDNVVKSKDGDATIQSVVTHNNCNNVKVLLNFDRDYITTKSVDTVSNGLNKIGMKCINPSSHLKIFRKSETNTYVVSALDNLNTICKKYNLNKEEIIKINNLKSEKLFIGQMLKLD